MRRILARLAPPAVTPQEAAEAREDGLTTLSDVMAENMIQHWNGCHGRGCLGGCIQRTRNLWSAAGFE